MATFLYKCDTCVHEFEAWLSSHTKPNPPCEKCAGATVRQIGYATPARFLGAGWAKDNYSTTNRGEQRQSDHADRKGKIVSFAGQKNKGRSGL